MRIVPREPEINALTQPHRGKMETIELPFQKAFTSLEGLDPEKSYKVCSACKKLFDEYYLETDGANSYCDPCYEAFLQARLPKLPNVSDEDLLAVIDELLRLADESPIPTRDRCRDEALGRLGDFSRRERKRR